MGICFLKHVHCCFFVAFYLYALSAFANVLHGVYRCVEDNPWHCGISNSTFTANFGHWIR